ncbi:MAG: kelch repeat-containing protein [Nannocystaceae bacterium]
MNDRIRILPVSLLLLLVPSCGDDSPAEPADGSSGTTAGTSETNTTEGPGTTIVATTSTSDTTADDTAGSESSAGPPEIEVTIDGMAVSSGDAVEIATPVVVGEVGTGLTVEVRNVGSGVLSVASVALDAGDTVHFSLDDTGLDPVVEPGGATSATVAFSPLNGGRKAAQLLIESDASGEAMFVVQLQARTPANTYRELSPVTSPSARFNHGMVGLADDRAVLFGGRQADGTRVSDTWVFEGELGDWMPLSPAQSPSARDTPALASVGQGRVLLFGGTETSGPAGFVTPRDDTWVLDLASGEWTELAPAVSPPARFQHGMVGIGDGLALLYGGRPDFALELSDTWVFDVAAETWTELAPPANPGPRSAFAMASDGLDLVAMVGGTPNSSTLVDQTWTYSVAANTWTMGATAGAGDQFNNSMAWLDGGPFVVFSGKADCCTDPIPGTWAYDGDADAWTELTPKLEPAPRFSHRTAHLGRDKLIIFGGLTLNGGPSSAVAQTWEYVGP